MTLMGCGVLSLGKPHVQLESFKACRTVYNGAARRLKHLPILCLYQRRRVQDGGSGPAELNRASRSCLN